MNRKDIDVLIIWLIAALLVSNVAAPFLLEYSKLIIESATLTVPYGMTKGNMIVRAAALSIIAKLLVNFVIAFWIFKTTRVKKLLWVIFSLLAGWWALPLFIFYQYFAEETHNQLLQKKIAE